MLALLIALASFADEPAERPTCQASIVVERVSPASVDRTKLEAVDTRGVRQSEVIALTDTAALPVVRAARVAAR